MKSVYLDNGATTAVAPEVLKVMTPLFTDKYGNASSLHSFGTEAKELLEESREFFAKKLGAGSGDKIAFTASGSESDNLAIKGFVKKGDHVVTSSIEHPAVLSTCRFLEKTGVEVTYLPVDREGFISLQELEKAIKSNTKLVSVIFGNHEIGTIQDVAAIGKLCHERSIIFHTDAVQAFCKVPVDVKKMNIDLLSASAHKIHGPKGAALLYIREGLRPEPLVHGGGHEFGFRSGTENIPGIVGFAKAADLYSDKEIERIRRLRDRMISGCLKIPDSWLNGPRERRLPNNVHIGIDFIEGEALVIRLDNKGIAASTGSACSSHTLEPSHILLAIGLPHEKAHGSLRLTLGRFNTNDDVTYLLDVLPKEVEALRRMSPFGRKSRQIKEG